MVGSVCMHDYRNSGKIHLGKMIKVFVQQQSGFSSNVFFGKSISRRRSLSVSGLESAAGGSLLTFGPPTSPASNSEPSGSLLGLW